MTASAISTEQLTKYYGPVRGVEDLDLEVQAGEIYGFLGPNGAGKTTTLRLLLDLIRPDRGRAYIFGKDVHKERAEVHRMVGYLPGELALWPELTGRENLEYLARLRGGVDRAYLNFLLELFEVDPGRRFATYSRGNKQKIGLVQAFMHKPRLLLLDEPTQGLDPLMQNIFYKYIRELTADGVTVFLSSHILSEVERVCHRAGIIREGRLIQSERINDLQIRSSHFVRLLFDGQVDLDAVSRVPGAENLQLENHQVTLTVAGDLRPLLSYVATLPLVELESRRPSLEELFMAYYKE